MADEKETLKLKISKKAYVFDVRKRFAASRNFAVKKKPETPADDIREKLKEILEKKKLPLDKQMAGQSSAQGARSTGAQVAPTAAAKPQGTSPAKIAAVAAAALLLGIFALLVLFPPGRIGAQAEAQKIEPFGGSYGFSVDEARVLTVEGAETTQRTGYFLIS